MKKKEINEQTIVITGASSGIGLATAYLLAEKGARVVLASRNESDLKGICEKIENKGGTATYVKADVSSEEEVQKIADYAIKTYGGFDTWVNNAGVGLYENLIDTPIEDERRLFETNYWGVVYGTQTAMDHLREKGGTIINMGSVASERAVPLLGTYSASKHAVKSFSGALRMENEKENIPVNIVVIKPTSINTQFVNHARNRMKEKASLLPPLYDPGLVAKAILKACRTYQRELFVPKLAGTALAQMEHLMPRSLDRMMEWKAFDLQKKDGERKDEVDGLYEAPPKEGKIRGDYEGHVFKQGMVSDTYTYPRKLLTIATIGLSALGLLWYTGSKS